MNSKVRKELKNIVQLLFKSSNRINQNNSKKYWYPLSLATYDEEEIIEALDSMCNFRTTMWEKTKLFESRFAAFQGCADAVMVNSGSSADLLLAFLLTNPLRPRLTPGDEVLVPIVTWPTQIWSLKMAGLKVRLVDADPLTLNMDVEDLENRITPKSKAIFVVHLMGNPCNMDKILTIAKKNNLLIIEDCCESLGAKWNNTQVGNFGIGGSFSFFFSHHITTMEGGMIACPNKEIADQLRIMRAHGWLRNVDQSTYKLSGYDVDPRYAFVNWGFNLRPTEIQSAFGLHQLKKLHHFNNRRIELSRRFFSSIEKTDFLSKPLVFPKATPSWFALPLMVNKKAPFTKKDITEYLESNGIETRPIITGNIARQPVAKLFPEFSDRVYPGADEIHHRGFYVGLSPLLTDSEMDQLIKYLANYLARA